MDIKKWIFIINFLDIILDMSNIYVYKTLKFPKNYFFDNTNDNTNDEAKSEFISLLIWPNLKLI